MQAIGDIISYFFSYYFNCNAKKCTKIQLGENKWYFFSQCLYFFPLRPCNTCFTLSQTVHWGENFARGKSNHIFPAEHIIFLWQYLSWVFQLGENIWYFSHSVFIFAPVSLFFPPVSSFFPSKAMQLIVLLSRAVNWGKIFFVYVFPPGHAVWYLFYLSS